MTTKYPGGLIRKTPPTITPPVLGEGGSAPGMWTLEQASYYTKTGTWPLPVIQGALWDFGYNSSGQLGKNDRINRSSPVQVGALTTWNVVAGGSSASCAIKSDGTLWSWGNNGDGQLGQNDVVNRSSPTQVGALTNWLRVCMGLSNQTIAVKTDNTLWSWGLNSSGQLGQNDTASRSSPTQVGSLNTWLSPFVMAQNSGCLKTDKSIWVCGLNFNGELGQNDTISRSSPVQVGNFALWSNVNGINGSVFAITTSNAIYSWGLNDIGQLGLNDIVYRSSPTQIGALTNWSKTFQGHGYTTYLIKTDGTLWTCGSNSYGQLGLNAKPNRSSPTQIGGLTDWSIVSGGKTSTIAIKNNGTLWSWGSNIYGELGQNDVNYRSSPTQVGSLTTWQKNSAGETHVLATKT